jgi:hypothetical protein
MRCDNCGQIRSKLTLVGDDKLAICETCLFNGFVVVDEVY